MRRLWAGMLLASLPLGLLAQTLDRRPPRDDLLNPAPRPPDEQMDPAPPEDQASPVPADLPPPDNSVTATPLPPPDNSVTATPLPPPDDSVTATPLPPPDDSVTATPLPPPDQPDNPTDPSQQLVPNPLDNPNTLPLPGASGPAQAKAQPQGQSLGEPERGAWVQMGTATLQALDKVNAISKTLVVKVGDTGHFGSLAIAVHGCFVRAPDRPADATAFLVIRDQRADAPSFTGWMVRSAPSMSMLAHPLYDVRVAGCAS